MHTKFLSQWFNVEELYNINNFVRLIRTEDSVNVDLAYMILQSSGLFSRLLAVLREYYKDTSFRFEQYISAEQINTQYTIFLDIDTPFRLPSYGFEELTIQEKGILIYSLGDEIGGAYYNNIARPNGGNNYENIPIPIFSNGLEIICYNFNKLSFLKYEFLNIPILYCSLELAGENQIELPYLNIQQHLSISLKGYTHIRSIFNNLIQYDKLERLTIITNLYKNTDVSSKEFVTYFQLPPSIRELNLIVEWCSMIVIPPFFIQKLLLQSPFLSKLTFRKGVHLQNETINLLIGLGFEAHIHSFRNEYTKEFIKK